MDDFYVKVGREKIQIDKDVFLTLFDLSSIEQYKPFQDALENREINFSLLKEYAEKASIPYPLFFAPKNVVQSQVKDKEKSLYKKLPSKAEMQLNSRGKMRLRDVELIVKDLGRKQEFLKNRILTSAVKNTFVGLIAKQIKDRKSAKQMADQLKSDLGVNLTALRGLSKEKVLQYLTDKVEDRGVLVSFSSYNFMPQNIDREIGVSGFCIKDKKFPYIFINTRDGDSNPKILETSGRQIFTLVVMLVCIAMNRFVFSTKKGVLKSKDTKVVYSIVGEFLIPREDAVGLNINDINELKQSAQLFKVTPSMLIMRLRELNLIDKKLADTLRDLLKKELKEAQPKQLHSPTQITGYSKYNGSRFSREVIRAHKSKLITSEEVRNILFRKGKMNSNLFQEYNNKFQ